MCDQNAGRVVALELRREQLEHFGGGFRIEIAGRLIGQHQRRTMRQRASDGDALHLAAGEL